MPERLSPHAITADLTTAVANFVPNPNLRLGDTDSTHGVIFGDLDGYGEVAVKPHQKIQRAWREQKTLETAAERGIHAIKPLMVADGELSSYLVTQRLPGLYHLGQTDWAVSAESRSLKSVVEPALEVAARSIAARHQRGLVKLDCTVKNIVLESYGADVLADAEAVLVDVPSEHRSKHGNQDLRNLGCSALHRGLLSEKPPEYRIGFLTENFLEPYFAQVDPSQFPQPVEDRTLAVQGAFARYFDKVNRQK